MTSEIFTIHITRIVYIVNELIQWYMFSNDKKVKSIKKIKFIKFVSPVFALHPDVKLCKNVFRTTHKSLIKISLKFLSSKNTCALG